MPKKRKPRKKARKDASAQLAPGISVHKGYVSLHGHTMPMDLALCAPELSPALFRN